MDDLGLDLPARTSKPRDRGLTIVIDSGAPLGAFMDAIDSSRDYIDLVKFGWGTALVTRYLDEKISFLEELGIGFFFGGTLFEKFVMQDRFDEYLKFCLSRRCRVIEISNGTIPMSNALKAGYIRRANAEFVVLSEVGYKEEDRSEQLSPGRWIEFIDQDLHAGARYVITEARESGRSGICSSDGSPRFDVVERILGSGLDTDRLIFEAPTKQLQTFFITRVGPDVNLGNVAIGDVLAAETLRLGLRADTLLHFQLERTVGGRAGQVQATPRGHVAR